MKIIEKVKKIFSSIGIVCITLTSRVFAIDMDSMIQPMYGITEPDPVPTISNSIWNICRFFVIPVALLIGIIIYFKKSKSSDKRKIITILITLAIVALLYLGINYLMQEVL